MLQKFNVFLLFAALKLLLIPSYFSTDFEVHRNWLAITHSLPISKWYFDSTSANATLDYPPFFAWFEYALSLIGCSHSKLFDTKMCQLESVGYSSFLTIVFQRLTVILVSDLLYYMSLLRYFAFLLVDSSASNKKRDEKETSGSVSSSVKYWTVIALSYGMPSLIMVDNIHFQYNALLFGIFVYSICFVQEGKLLLSGITFAVLLNFKHIFLYMAPSYFVFLLVHYCCNEKKVPQNKLQSSNPSTPKQQDNSTIGSFNIFRFLKLSVSVIGVFLLSFGPFILVGGLDQIKQIVSRMFPFERGLTHAYWAPNFWALYNTIDKFALIWTKFMNKSSRIDTGASLTGGLVGLDQGVHVILPKITPAVTILLSMGSSFIISCIIVYRARKNLVGLSGRDRYEELKRILLYCVVHSTFANFYFGWHVHEKAVLMILVPLVLMVVPRKGDNGNAQWRKVFGFLSIVGTYSLFPLLFRSFETPIKYTMLVSYSCAYYFATNFILGTNTKQFHGIEKFYLFGIIFVECYSEFLHYSVLPHLSFLPLMLISFYTAIGVSYAWILSVRAMKE